MVEAKSNKEIEIKLHVPNTLALLFRLKHLRAKQIVPRAYESNILYDVPSRKLTRQDQIIRIRIERRAVKGKKPGASRSGIAVLTYKGPMGMLAGRPNASGKSDGKPRFKIREEVEVIVSDGEQMEKILGSMGLDPVFQYEKFRTTYVLPGIRGLKVEIDETPIGTFLELEGNTSAIDRAATLLGYSRLDYVTETYGALYIENCRRNRRKPSNMIFPTKKSR